MTDDTEQCDHEWIPFGLRRYNRDYPDTGRGAVAEFFRVDDITCLYCGEVRPVRGEGSLQEANRDV